VHSIKPSLFAKYQRTADAPSLTHFQAALAVPIIGSLKPLQNPNGSLKRNNCRHSRAGGDERYIGVGAESRCQRVLQACKPRKRPIQRIF